MDTYMLATHWPKNALWQSRPGVKMCGRADKADDIDKDAVEVCSIFTSLLVARAFVNVGVSFIIALHYQFCNDCHTLHQFK